MFGEVHVPWAKDSEASYDWNCPFSLPVSGVLCESSLSFREKIVGLVWYTGMPCIIMYAIIYHHLSV